MYFHKYELPKSLKLKGTQKSIFTFHLIFLKKSGYLLNKSYLDLKILTHYKETIND